MTPMLQPRSAAIARSQCKIVLDTTGIDRHDSSSPECKVFPLIGCKHERVAGKAGKDAVTRPGHHVG